MCFKYLCSVQLQRIKKADTIICCRKPRINPQLVAQQVAQQFAPPPKKERSNHERKEKKQKNDEKHKGLVINNKHPFVICMLVGRE